MPRTKPLIRPDPREIAVRKEINGGMGALQMKQYELARQAGMPASTLSYKLKNIGSLTLAEYWAIQKVFERGGIT